MKQTSIRVLFLIVLFVHVAAALFVHYAEFYPFGGFVVPDELVPKLLNAFLAAVSALLVYFIAREVGAGKRGGFIAGLLVGLYPSFLYYGSLLAHDAIIVSLAMLALLAMVRLIKQFSLLQFLIFCMAVGLLIYFRFYVGFVVLFTFLAMAPFMFPRSPFLDKVLYGSCMIVVLGFLPQIFGYGYYGANIIPNYLRPSVVERYHEVFYFSAPQFFSKRPFAIPFKGVSNEEFPTRVDAHDVLRFASNYTAAYTFVALGPFPWHITHVRQLLVFIETIPWYILLAFMGTGMYRARERWRFMIPLLVFSAGMLGVAALFIDNFGIYTRFRMPA